MNLHILFAFFFVVFISMSCFSHKDVSIKDRKQLSKNRGYNAFVEQRYERAAFHYENLLSMAYAQNDKREIVDTTYNLALCYYMLEKYDDVFNILDKNPELLDKQNLLTIKAKTYFRLNDYTNFLKETNKVDYIANKESILQLYARKFWLLNKPNQLNEILEQVKTFEPKQQSLEIEITIYKLILQKDFKIALTQVTELIKIEQKQRNYRRMCDMMFLRIMILKQLDDKNSLQKYTFEAQQVALNQNRPYLAKYGLFKNSK